MIRTTIAAALISISTLAAMPAQASDIDVRIDFGGSGWSGGHHGHGHGHHMRHRRLSTEEVRWILRDYGYRNIRFFDDHGPVYQLSAHKRGNFYFLVVSARTGEILSRNRI